MDNKYLKIMDKLIEYNNKLTEELTSDKAIGEKVAVERVMLIINKIMLENYKDDEKEPTEESNESNIVFVKTFKWAGLEEEVCFDKGNDLYFIDSKDYGFESAKDLIDLEKAFKMNVRNAQVLINEPE